MRKILLLLVTIIGLSSCKSLEPDVFAPDYQNGLYTNRGWRLNNMHTGSGVGIRMLP